MAQQTIKNPDGSTTYRDTTTGAERTVKDGVVSGQNFAKGTGVSSNVAATVDPAVQRNIGQQRAEAVAGATTPANSGTTLTQAANRASTAGLGVLSGERAFTLDELQRAASQVMNAGSAVGVPNARFQTTQGVGDLIRQMQGELQPLTDARLTANEADANRRAQLLQNQLAATGSLRGGGGVSQLLDAERAFQRDQDVIRGEQLAQAVPWALQAGELGLNEAQMRFTMEDANRQFMLNRAQQYFNNLAQGMSQEEAQRQFQAGFEADLAQNAFNNLLGQQEQQEQSRQFDASQALAQDEFRERQRQFNIDAATNLSDIFGLPVMPKAGGQELFAQVQGQTPTSTRQALGQLTGIDPVTGQPTFQAREAAANRAMRVPVGGGSGIGEVGGGAVFEQARQLGNPQDAFTYLVQNGVSTIDAQRFAENAFGGGADFDETNQEIQGLYAWLQEIKADDRFRNRPDEIRRQAIGMVQHGLATGQISDATANALFKEIDRMEDI